MMIQVSGYGAQQAKAPLTWYSFERSKPRDHDVVIDIEDMASAIQTFTR